jgi:hypothetical protein
MYSGFSDSPLHAATKLSGLDVGCAYRCPLVLPGAGLLLDPSRNPITLQIPHARKTAASLGETKAKAYDPKVMDEGRKRVLAIIAGILVARHLKTTEDLFDTRDSPRTRSMVIAAIQCAKRIMLKIDEECGRS